MSDYQQLLHNFEQLGLHRMKEYFPNYLELMNNQSIPLYKDEKKIERALKKARFPKIKRMMDFDFGYQPSINKQQVLDLQHLSFLDKQENLLFIGSPGVGKSHLATSIGICACKQGVRTLFINCHELLLRLQSAYENNTIERVMKRYANYDLLIIDELWKASHNSSYGKLNIM